MPSTSLKRQTDVHALPLPKDGEAVYFDEGKPSERVSGLALRIRVGGSRKFVFFYRLGGRQLKYTLGDATGLRLDEARAEARKLRVKVDRGENPATEKAERTEASKLDFESVMEKYLEAKGRKMKPRSLEEITRHMRKRWKPFHKLAIGSLTRSMVAGRLDTIAKESGPVAADRARSTLSDFYGWSIGEGYDVTNPVMGTNKHSEDAPRDRLLSDAELVKIWNGAPDNDYGRIVRLLMLTAQRREEIGGLQDDEIKKPEKMIVLPGERTKNGRAHEVPLSDMAVAVLEKQPRRLRREAVFGEGEGGYSGWSRSKQHLDDVVKLKPWTLHDLRRTAATRMADLGVQPHIIEAILNHVSGHKAGVAGIYNRSSYQAEKRAALDLWANHLKVELAKASGGNIHRLTQTSR